MTAIDVVVLEDIVDGLGLTSLAVIDEDFDSRRRMK